jgi:hypothetical protein
LKELIGVNSYENDKKKLLAWQLIRELSCSNISRLEYFRRSGELVRYVVHKKNRKIRSKKINFDKDVVEAEKLRMLRSMQHCILREIFSQGSVVEASMLRSKEWIERVK